MRMKFLFVIIFPIVMGEGILDKMDKMKAGILRSRIPIRRREAWHISGNTAMLLERLKVPEIDKNLLSSVTSKDSNNVEEPKPPKSQKPEPEPDFFTKIARIREVGNKK